MNKIVAHAALLNFRVEGDEEERTRETREESERYDAADDQFCEGSLLKDRENT